MSCLRTLTTLTLRALPRATAGPSRVPALLLTRRAFSSDVPTDRKFAKSHEWIKVDGDIGTVGITSHAAGELGDVVFVDLPEVGSSFDKESAFGAIESVKAASDVYSPVSGEVVEVNSALSDTPGTINQDAHGDGWMMKIKLSNKGELDGLLSSEAYAALLEE